MFDEYPEYNLPPITAIQRMLRKQPFTPQKLAEVLTICATTDLRAVSIPEEALYTGESKLRLSLLRSLPRFRQYGRTRHPHE